jgi:hypothetical protein
MASVRLRESYPDSGAHQQGHGGIREERAAEDQPYPRSEPALNHRPQGHRAEREPKIPATDVASDGVTTIKPDPPGTPASGCCDTRTSGGGNMLLAGTLMLMLFLGAGPCRG